MERCGRCDLLHGKPHSLPAKPHILMSMIVIMASEGSAADPRPNTTTGKRWSNLQIDMLLVRRFSILGRDRSDELNNEGDAGKREGCEIE